MPFPERARKYHLRSQGAKCQTLIDDGKEGYRICGSTRKLEVDHIDPESEQLANGQDPNNSPGIVRCQRHHTGLGVIFDRDTKEKRVALFGERPWSRHPDMGRAREQYVKGDKKAFKKAAIAHHNAATNGRSITNDDWRIRESEKRRVAYLQQQHAQKTGERPPQVKPHKLKKPTISIWSRIEGIMKGVIRIKEDEE